MQILENQPIIPTSVPSGKLMYPHSLTWLDMGKKPFSARQTKVAPSITICIKNAFYRAYDAYMYVLPPKKNHPCFKKRKYVTNTNKT